METITYNNGTITSIDVYNAMRTGCEFWSLPDNFNDLNSSQWDVVLKCVGNLTKNTKCIYNTDKSVNCVYNRDIIYTLLDNYIELCNIYSKRISIMGYCNYIGIHDVNMLDKDGLSADIIAIIKTSDSERVASQATDSNVPVLRLAYNNFIHNWSGQIKQNEIKTTVRTLDEIKRERLGTSADDVQNARFSLSSNCTNDEKP